MRKRNQRRAARDLRERWSKHNGTVGARISAENGQLLRLEVEKALELQKERREGQATCGGEEAINNSAFFGGFGTKSQPCNTATAPASALKRRASSLRVGAGRGCTLRRADSASNLFEMAGPPPLPTFDPTRWSNIDYATLLGVLRSPTTTVRAARRDFTSAKLTSKNKFCAACRETLDVPAWRVRALTEEMRALYMSNSLSAGVWKRAPVELGGEFRLVNNTITCDGPWLVIYREEPPDLEWEPLPTGWIENGLVRMSVAKGTLVPICELSHPSARRAAAQPSVLDAAATSSTGSPEGGKRQKRRAGVMTQGAEPQPPEADLSLQPLVGGAHHNTPCCMSMPPVSPSMPQVQGMTVGGGSPQVQVGAAPAVALLRPCAAAVQPHVQQIPPTMTTASPFQQQLAHQPDHAVRQGMAAYPPQAVVPPQPVAPASGDPAVWWAYRGGQPSMPAMAPLPGVPLTSVPSSGSSSAGVGRGSGIGGSADNDPRPCPTSRSILYAAAISSTRRARLSS